MSGTLEGGRKAAITNKKKYGKDFYIRNGRKGGLVCTAKGFGLSHERAVEAGRKGGLNSKRGKAKKCKVSS